MNDRILAYSDASFQRQTRLLKKELSNLGVQISSNQAAKLSFLSRRKYDRYDHFFPGESFDSRLLKWLSNFDKNERQVAFEIIKNLKFVSAYEIKELAIRTFENAKKTIKKEMKIPQQNWYDRLEARNIRLKEELEKSIFVAAVDDANFSYFRRYASSHYPFKKDNFVEYYKTDEDTLNELPEHTRIFIIDQLTGSGTTALRRENGTWKGKIARFVRIWKKHINSNTIYYCPYIISEVANRNLEERICDYVKETKLDVKILPTCKIGISPCLSNNDGTDIDEEREVSKLCQNYYNRFKEDEHIRKGGPALYGYGRAGLTLVLQSNCPNNTIYLLWHSYNKWYPLFPRITHHR